MVNSSDCREHARQCRELALTVNPQMRADLLRTAEMWERLADDQEDRAHKEEIKAYIKKWDAG